MGIARYHLAKKSPYAKDALAGLREAEISIQQATKVEGQKGYYHNKDMEEASKYLELISTLRHKIISRSKAIS